MALSSLFLCIMLEVDHSAKASMISPDSYHDIGQDDLVIHHIVAMS